ncbi:MAG: lamin tail domain-containing protein [bacterium]
MKKKRRKKITSLFFCHQIFLTLLLAVFFVFRVAEAKIVINEILIGDQKSTKNEFVELYNDGSEDVSLGGYKLMKKTESGNDFSSLVSATHFLGTIGAHNFFVIAHPQYKQEIKADLDYSSSSYSIAANNTVGLLDKSGVLLDLVGWGDAKSFKEKPFTQPLDGESYGRLDGKDTGNNSEDFVLLENPSPGKENKKFTEKEKIKYPNGIFLNELYPHPNKNTNEREYVELFNSSGEKIVLDGWKIVDYGKNVCLLDGKSIENKKFLVVEDEPEKNCTLELNDSGTETVELKNPNGETVSMATYPSAKEGKSFSFDGLVWRWTKFLTKGLENIFNNLPFGELEIDDDVFVDVYASFFISTGDIDGESIKVVWDFGDGHKSYLAKTTHKYSNTGKYQVMVKITDGNEDVVKNFIVEVKECSHPKIKIVAIDANPAGSDGGSESITVENKTKKKINLNGWSVATGWKKFVNHPIRQDVIIKGKKEKQLNNEVARFSLNNTKAKIQLRYPDGKVAHEVKYKAAEGSIAEGERYVKVKGVGWKWILQNPKPKMQNSTIEIFVPDQSLQQEAQFNNQNDEEIVENKAEEVVVSQNEIKKKNKFALLYNQSVKIKLLKVEPGTLEMENMHEIDGVYFFTPQNEEHEHYTVTFLRNIPAAFNLKLNMLLNYFSK